MILPSACFEILCKLKFKEAELLVLYKLDEYTRTSFVFHSKRPLASISAAVGIGIIFIFALHKWSLPSRAQDQVARLVSEYAQELDIQNLPLFTPEQYLDEIATQLEFKWIHHGIEKLPVGHSWTELAQSVISTINTDLTDLSTLTYVHALLLEGGCGYNPIMTKSIEIISMWGAIS